jgi:hypothetical protein
MLPLVVVADFGLLIYALGMSIARRRAVRGRYIARDFPAGPKTTPRGAAHRAWTVLVGGYSPNAYVVDIDPDENVVLVHDLVPWRRSEEPA